MTLSEQIGEDMKNAMRAKEEAELSTLRLLRSALKNKQIDIGHELSDAEVQDVVRVQVKQLKDSLTTFEAGGRADVVDSVKAELQILAAYLPAEMSDEELSAIVKQAVTDSGATQKSEMGKAMGFVMKAVAGRADGTRVKSLVDSLLGVFTFLFISHLLAAHPAHAAIDLVSVATGGDLFTPYLPYLPTALRCVRVLFLIAGLFSVNEIIHGGFKMSTQAARDHEHHHAEHLMIGGFIGTTVVIGLFCVTTLVLQRIS